MTDILTSNAMNVWPWLAKLVTNVLANLYGKDRTGLLGCKS